MTPIHIRFGGYLRPFSTYTQAVAFLSEHLRQQFVNPLNFELIPDALAFGAHLSPRMEAQTQTPLLAYWDI